MTDYELIRSDRRTVSMEVTREGKVVVRAPARMRQDAIDAFVRSHERWLAGAKARQQAREEQYPEPDEAEKQRLIGLARTVLPEKVAAWAARMGVKPTGITITGAEKRFGSCSGKNRVCFSWRLMRYPEPAIDYVVVHELAHIRHKNHSSAFYACVARYLPDYKEREKLLR